jgi:hypothetical protein
MKGWKKFGDEAIFRPIYETQQTPPTGGSAQGKKIGEFSHYRENQNCTFIGLKVQDGPEMHVRRDAITVEGYKKPWVPTRYMATNRDRYECASWVYQLICEGKFESHRNGD